MTELERLRAELERVRAEVLTEKERHVRAMSALAIREMQAEDRIAWLQRDRKQAKTVHMTPEQKVAISATMAPGGGLGAAARAAGLSKRGLAKAIGMSPTALRLAETGERPISRVHAAQIEALTSYAIGRWKRLAD